MDIETRYNKIDGYNRKQILNNIKNKIKADGGKILKYGKLYNIKAYTNDTNPERIEKIENLPALTCYGYGYGGDELRFINGEYYYEISYDENPFFPITFRKIKINKNGEYIGRRYSDSNEEHNEKSYKKSGDFVFSLGYDGLYKVCTAEDIEEMAKYHYNQIKNFLYNQKESETYNDRKRIQNYYNNSYHYETIYDKTPCKIEMIFEEVGEND